APASRLPAPGPRLTGATAYPPPAPAFSSFGAGKSVPFFAPPPLIHTAYFRHRHEVWRGAVWIGSGDIRARDGTARRPRPCNASPETSFCPRTFQHDAPTSQNRTGRVAVHPVSAWPGGADRAGLAHLAMAASPDVTDVAAQRPAGRGSLFRHQRFHH